MLNNNLNSNSNFINKQRYKNYIDKLDYSKKKKNQKKKINS